VKTLIHAYFKFRYSHPRYRAPLPRITYAGEAVRAYVNALEYRKYRKHVLAGVLAWMAVRRLAR
jgi:hypothetical protein